MNSDNDSVLSAVQGQVNSTEMDGKYLTFITDKQLFGVPIADVVQIVGMQNITAVPEFPSYARGIINLRGAIIPLIDMRLRLSKQECEYDERTCIIVTLIKDVTVGFIVDEVDAVTMIDESDVSSPPSLSADSANSYITGVAKTENRVVLLLSIAKLLSNEELTNIAQTEGVEHD